MHLASCNEASGLRGRGGGGMTGKEEKGEGKVEESKILVRTKSQSRESTTSFTHTFKDYWLSLYQTADEECRGHSGVLFPS